MKKLLIITLLFSHAFASDCDHFAARWKSCSVESPRLNNFQRVVVNSYIKPYELQISKLSEYEFRFLGIYKKFLGRNEVVHDDTLRLGIPVTIYWNDLPDGKTAPVLNIFTECVDGKIFEKIEWANLDEANYTRDYIRGNDKYFESVYSIKNDYLKREIVSKKNASDEFKFLATLRCERKN